MPVYFLKWNVEILLNKRSASHYVIVHIFPQFTQELLANHIFLLLYVPSKVERSDAAVRS